MEYLIFAFLIGVLTLSVWIVVEIRNPGSRKRTTLF